MTDPTDTPTPSPVSTVSAPAAFEDLASQRKVVVAALRYIQRFSGTRTVIKYGGAAMVDPELKRSFAQDVVLLRAAGLLPVVVHGGGPEINRTLERLGQKSEFVDGQRITGPEEIKVVEMVLTGKVNSEIVGLLSALGGSAMGLSGKDGRMLQARKQQPRPGKPDLGLVGDIETVNPEVLDMCLGKGYIPVVSPVGAGLDGTTYNINADVAAAEVAVAIKARKLIFLTDVAGILDEQGQLISEMSASDLRTRLQEGRAVKGGMQVKANAILRALEGGVGEVHVVDGRVLHSVVVELFTDKGVGTLVTP
jgi:acetylglutamate kinase